MADAYTPPSGENLVFRWAGTPYTPPEGDKLLFRWGKPPSTPLVAQSTGGLPPSYVAGTTYEPNAPAPTFNYGSIPDSVVPDNKTNNVTVSGAKKGSIEILCVNLKRPFYVRDDTNIIQHPAWLLNKNDKHIH